MPKINLTHQGIKSAEPGEYYDTNDKGRGLVLRVLKSGIRRFEFRYWMNGIHKRFHIGEFPGVSLTEARNKHLTKLKARVNDGIDPQAERDAKKNTPEEMSFREFSEIYDGIHLPTLRTSSREYHKWAMDVKVLPVLGKLRVEEITKQHINRLLDKIAIDGGAEATANKVRSRLHHMFEFGKSRSFVDENPVADTKPYPGGNNQSERYYSSDEIKKIWQAIEQLNEPVQSYLKIIMLTGQRRTETHMMKWENIKNIKDEEFKGWMWTIPKDLAKSDRDHDVPLSPFALDVIFRLKDRAGSNPYVFASGSSDDIPIGLKTIKRATREVRKAKDGVSDYRLHDTRRTVATWLARLQTPAEVVSKVLNHKTGAGGSLVTRIYNRYQYRSERQTALNRWANQLVKIIEGETETKIHRIGG